MITLALDRYDRHFPFFDGTATLPSGLELRVLQVGQQVSLRDGRDRHRRMLVEHEFDAAETSFSSYVVARSQGLPLTAIPIFPRRLFSLGQIFVNAESGIEHPADLEGKSIGLQSFQTTLAVLAKGDLASEYGVPLDSIQWRVKRLDTVASAGSCRFDITLLADDLELADALAIGEIDALFYSRTPCPANESPRRIRRLFQNPRAVENEYFQRNGFWPIMHVIALAETAVAAQPDMPVKLFSTFTDAFTVASGYLDDPNWSQSAWAKYSLDEEREALGRALWPCGVAKNRANLEKFLAYSFDQGLIERPMSVEELFHPSVLET